MFSTKGDNIFNSLRYKLTVWFSIIFTAVFFLIFFIIHLSVRNHLYNLSDANLLKQVKRQLWLGYTPDITPDFIKDINEAFAFISSKEGSSDVFYIFLDSTYRTITSSSLEHWQGLRLDSTSIPFLPDKPGKDQIKLFLDSHSNKKNSAAVIPLNHEFRSHTILQTEKINGRDDKIRIAFQYFNNKCLFITGVSLQDNEDFMLIVRRLFLILYVLLQAVVIVLVYIFTTKTLDGVENVKNTAIKIGKKGFGHRVPYQNETNEIKGLAKAFNEMLGRIERLMKEQKDMTRNIAHDLRSPITSIRGIAETSLNSHPSVNDYEFMTGKIIDNCDRLIHLINSMLDISDIESGNFTLKTQRINIQNILVECYEIYKAISDEKNIKFRLQKIDKSIFIRGDKQLLQRAFGNLVDNALKFTNTGGTVEVEAETSSNQVKICIRDNGSGISKKAQKHIFERFYRVDKSRSVDGSGLGLSLAEAYIKYQKGRIEVESEEGKGSSFIIYLPLD